MLTHTYICLTQFTCCDASLNQPLKCWLLCVCDLIGACWGSRDTSVRVSTFHWRTPISQVTLHIIYYLSIRTQEGLHVAEWQLWFGRKPPSPRATDALLHQHPQEYITVLKIQLYIFLACVSSSSVDANIHSSKKNYSYIGHFCRTWCTSNVSV